MFYEGTEKRLEIIIKQTNLLSVPELFWKELVAQAGAFILSKIENATICAYLLSESSLFIWQDRMLLITCGNTHLVKAAQFFQKKYPQEQILSLLFQRHQPLQPQLQKSAFAQDATLLHSQLAGITKHWQKDYQGDLFFFGKLNPARLNNKQILMLHGLSGSFAEQLQTGQAYTEQIAAKLSLKTFFPQLLIDQFTFTPKGYSLNAIAGNDFLTIHITPERLSAYLSLESSFTKQVLQPLVEHLIRLFKPSRKQLMSLTEDSHRKLAVTVKTL